MLTRIDKQLAEHMETLHLVRQTLGPQIEDMAVRLTDVLRRGGKVLICGNGGSAADAQHFAAELVGRFEQERTGLPAIALTTDSSCLTAIGNDYGFERLFSRQVEALARPEDALIGISTSGNSQNVLQAVEAAKKTGCETFVLSGGDGGLLAGAADLSITVPVLRTARVQEAHLTILHILCELIETALFAD